jgi:acyl-CoA synthetase (AMP-forming)/AMP-acid ligase II
VHRGDRVALLWSNDVRYVVCLLGVMRAGAVAVPLNVKLGDDVLAYVLDDASAGGILCGPDEGERAAALAGNGRFVVRPEDLSADAPAFEPPELEPGDLCMQPYTSGSTGRPKGVLLTHAGLLWNVDTVRSVLMLNERDRALIIAPMFHANAGTNVLMLLRAGGASVVMPRFDADVALDMLAEHRCTMVGGVPAIFRALLAAHERRPGLDVSSLRRAAVGSASVSPDLLAAFEDAFGVELLEGYGLTEGGPYVTVSPPWGVTRPGWSLPVPGCEVRVVDSSGSALPPDEVGELLVRNPGVTVGYHRLEELTAERLRDGWLATGDLARVDADGFLQIAGRADDMLNVGGENVYPTEVERLLLAHPQVSDAAVIGLDHLEKGQVPAAAVVAKPGEAPGEEELKRFCLERGPAYAHPRRVVVVDAMPLTGAGKPDRAALRALLENAEPTRTKENA